MNMTIGQLRQVLDEAEAQGATEDTEVRFAQQPQWPFEYSITTDWYVTSGEHGEDDDPSLPVPDPVLYLAEGRQLGYLPGDVAREIGW